MKSHRLYLGAICLSLAILPAPASTLFVNLNNASPVPPYADWSTAATNIQDAIDAAVAGDIVVVTNGLYAVGGKSMDGVITNRISVNKAITVQSVNGPAATVIQGAWDPASTNGPGAVRCVWLTNNATLSGFTLNGGATRADFMNFNSSSGGGVYGASNSIIANCTIKNNAATCAGGGAIGTTLTNCLLINNSVLGTPGDGTGGGASSCRLENCTVTGNYSSD